MAFPSYQLVKRQAELDFGKQISVTERQQLLYIAGEYFFMQEESMSWMFYTTGLQVVSYTLLLRRWKVRRSDSNLMSTYKWFKWIQDTALCETLAEHLGLGLFKKIFSVPSERCCTDRNENPISFTHINNSTQTKAAAFSAFSTARKKSAWLFSVAPAWKV